MSTRANIVVADEEQHIQLYRHTDGYPDGRFGVLEALKKALPFAWELPRMEADDFAAAIVRAWKDKGGGNIYIDGQGYNLHGDIEYLYIIRPNREKKCWTVKTYLDFRLMTFEQVEAKMRPRLETDLPTNFS